SRDGFDMTWRATVLTLFPEMFPGPLGVSLAGKALTSGLWSLEARDIRNSATDKHRSVDDTPAGGGPGMVLRADVLGCAIDGAEAGQNRPRLLMSPRGRPLTQSRVKELAAGPGPLVVCGRFEGVDQRVIEARHLEEVSIGDYVLSGGEIAAMALIDACVRLLPGVMGKQASGEDESFSEGLLEYPQFTRPQEFEGRGIPEILVSGDHAKVAAWRRAEAEALTRARRPDLWAARPGQKATKSTTDGGQARPDALYERQIRAMAGYKAFAQPAPDWLGAPPMEISMNLIQQLEKEQFDKLSATKTIPEFGPGDTVIVNVKVVEGERTRVQAYEGVCIGRSGGGLNESFTVRKISYGEGVERVFPVMSPMIDSIKVVRRGKGRRAKLYYLRQLRGKSARIVEKQDRATAVGEEFSLMGCDKSA